MMKQKQPYLIPTAVIFTTFENDVLTESFAYLDASEGDHIFFGDLK